jgi:hypothetical protein
MTAEETASAKRGVQDVLSGRITPWSELKKQFEDEMKLVWGEQDVE